jgi:hypothetical protein
MELQLPHKKTPVKLPKVCMRIRHYGFLANRCKRENLLKCDQFLDVSHELCESKGREFTMNAMLEEVNNVNLDNLGKSRSNNWIPAFAGMTDFLSV